MVSWEDNSLLLVSSFGLLDCILAEDGQDFFIRDKKISLSAGGTVSGIDREARTIRGFFSEGLGDELCQQLLAGSPETERQFSIASNQVDGAQSLYHFLMELLEDGGVLLRMVNHTVEQAEVDRLGEREALLELLIDIDPNCIFVKDSQGRYVLVNSAISQVYKAAPEEMIGRTDLELLGTGAMTEQEVADFIAADTRVISQGEAEHIPEESMTTADGEERWFRTVKVPLVGSGHPDYLLGIAVDISREVRARKALEERLHFQKKLLDTVPIPIYYQDKDLVYQGCNQAFIELTGLEREQLIGSAPHDIWPEDRADVYVEQDREVLSSRIRSVESRRERKPSGEVADLVVVKDVYLDSEGKPAGLVGAAVDLSEQRKMQQALQESETRYRRLFEESLMGIFLSDLDGSLREVNPAFAEMFECGSTRDALSEIENIGLAIETPDAEELRKHKARLEAGEPVVFEAVYRRCDGSHFTGRSHMVRVLDPISREVYVEGVIENVTEQRAAEDALMASEERFRTLYEAVQVGVLVQRPDGQIIHANQRASEILSLSESEITDRTEKHPDWQMVLEDGMPVSGEQHPSMLTLKTGKPLRNVIRGMYGGNGESTRWIMVNTVPVFEDDGDRVKEVIVTFSDITELKRTRDELVESERRLTTLLSNLPGMVYRCPNNRLWPMEFVSDGCLPMTGYSANELTGSESNDYGELIHPEDRERVWRTVQSALENDQHFRMEYRIRTRSGEERWVWEQGCQVSDEKGGILEGFIIDIHERWQAQQDLQKEEAHFRTVYEESPVGIAVVSLDMRFEDMNPAFEELIGYTSSEVEGKHLRDLTHPDDVDQNLELQDKLGKGEIPMFSMEKRLVHKDGHSVHVILVSSLISDSDGAPLHFLGQVLDISKRKQAEDEVLRINSELEERVRKRTVDLETANDDLRRFARLAAGREIRMAELKQEIRELRLELDAAAAGQGGGPR